MPKPFIKKFLLMICLSTISLAQAQKQTEKFIPSFNLKPNDLELSRLAQPTQYFDKIGQRAGLMGFESGQFEMWVWPWKVLRNFELQFLLGSSTQPILAKDIVRTISVTPEVTTLTYTYEAFTVKEHILIPRNEPGAILLLDVHTTKPLAIIPGFIPVMQPMWPAGVGGQYSYWDDDVKAYVISEGQQRGLFLCGSPAGLQMAAPPAHMFADNPLQFRIDVKPGDTDRKFIPLVIAGGPVDSAMHKMRMDPVKEIYTKLWTNAEKYYQQNYDYYQNLRSSTMQITTPDKEINLAYEWGKVALDNLMIENPNLGYGMVAGFGLSGGGARPGFGWFFGGDAFINSMAMNSVGMFQQSRDALAFTQKWQRQDNFPIRKKNPSDPPKDVGKMAHELSQSDGLCAWWNDYHYGYNHADTTPWYIVAMADYVRTSGDTAFLRQSWKSVKQAYEWCLSKDSDGDGLMDLKGAGLGALEFGKLVGIYADVYTCGVFVQAVKEMKYMAELVGDSAKAQQADAQFKKAQPRLEKLFWLDKEGYYAYGATDKGEQVHEKTPWSGVAMMFGLLDEERTSKSIEAFNSADLCTDWGVRTLSNKSELFEPTNYNYGAVWPFISSFFNTAQFKHHYALSGYQILQSNIKHVFDHALGVVPEVFSGELNEKLGEAYHHQGFSTTGYMLPLVRGLLGLEVDDWKPHKFLLLHPRLPVEWTGVRINHLKVGKEYFNLDIQRSDTSISFKVFSSADASLQVDFVPERPLGVEASAHLFNGKSDYHFGYDKVIGKNTYGIALPDWSPNASLEEMRNSDISELHMRIVGPTALLNTPKIQLGNRNASLRMISKNPKWYYRVQQYTIVVEGISGQSYSMGLQHSDRIKKIEGATWNGDMMIVSFEGKPKQEFVRKEIVIQLK